MSRPAPVMGEAPPSFLESALAAAKSSPTISPPGPATAYVPTPRRAAIRVEWQHPETGVVHVAEVVSVIGDAEQDRARAGLVAQLTNAMPWDVLPATTRKSATARALCLTQVVEPPPWFVEAIGLDEDFAVDLAGALLAHQRLFFRRDVEPGSPSARRSVVRPLDFATTTDPG